MRPRRIPFGVAFRATAVIAMVMGVPGCVAQNLATQSVSVGADAPQRVSDRARAQLTDGSIVIFPQGFRVDSARVVGDGWRYTPTLRDSVRITGIPRDSIAGIVAYRTTYDPAQSIGMTISAAVAAFFGLAIAFVGLCAATRCLA